MNTAVAPSGLMRKALTLPAIGVPEILDVAPREAPSPSDADCAAPCAAGRLLSPDRVAPIPNDSIPREVASMPAAGRLSSAGGAMGRFEVARSARTTTAAGKRAQRQ